MAQFPEDHSGMAHARSMAFSGFIQPHKPVVPIPRNERNAVGNEFMKFEPDRPPPSYPHFHKRSEFGGKLAQSLEAPCAYYATLTQKYCLRSSLTGLERHRVGVTDLRKANSRRGPVMPVRSLSVDISALHPNSLKPPRTHSMSPAPKIPEIARSCSLHQGWQTAFDAKGAVLMEDTTGGRDVQAIAAATKTVIDQEHKRQQAHAAAVAKERQDTVDKIRNEETALMKFWAERTARECKDQKDQTQRRRQHLAMADSATKAKTHKANCDYARQRREQDLAHKAAEAARKAEELRARQERCRRVKQGRADSKAAGNARRAKQVDELKALSLRAKTGDFGGRSEFEMEIEDEDAKWMDLDLDQTEVVKVDFDATKEPEKLKEPETS